MINRLTLIYVNFLIFLTILTVPAETSGQMNVAVPKVPPLPIDRISTPSPGPASLINFYDHPVNYASGVVDIHYSLARWNVGDFPMEVSIDYRTSGIKYDQSEGPVGTGWALNVGGSIVREVNGLPDELPFEPEKADLYNDTLDYDYLKEAYRGLRDTGLDRYRFNFNGKSGTFYIVNGSVHLMQSSGLVITPLSKDYLETGFRITDIDGTEYIFDVVETHRRKIVNDYVSADQTSFFGDYSYNSVWHLSKIITPNENDEINFIYQHLPISQSAHSCRSAGSVAAHNNLANIVAQSQYGTRITTDYINQAYLTAIESRTANITFDWTETMTITDGKRSRVHLDKVSVYNYLKDMVSHVELEYITSYQSQSLLHKLTFYNQGELTDWKMFQYNQIDATIKSDFFGNFSRTANHKESTWNTRTILNAKGEWNPVIFPDTMAVCQGLLNEITERSGLTTLFEYEASRHRLDRQPVTDTTVMLYSTHTIVDHLSPLHPFDEKDLKQPEEERDSTFGDAWWQCPVVTGARIKKITTLDNTSGQLRWREFKYRRSCPNIDVTALSVWAFVELSGYVYDSTEETTIPGISGEWTTDPGDPDPDPGVDPNPGLGSDLGLDKEDPEKNNTGNNDNPRGTPPYFASRPYACERNIAALEHSRLTGFRPENATVYYGEVTEIVGGNDISVPQKTVYYYDVRPAIHKYKNVGDAPYQREAPDQFPRFVKTRDIGSAYHELGYGAMFDHQLHNHGYFQENIGAQPLLLRKDIISYEMGRIRVAERYDYKYKKIEQINSTLNVENYIEPLSFGRRISGIGSIARFYDASDFNTYHVSVKYDDIRCDSVIHTIQDEYGVVRPIVYSVDYVDDPDVRANAGRVFGRAVSDIFYRLPLIQTLTASCGNTTIEQHYLYSAHTAGVFRNHSLHRTLPVASMWINAADTILTTIQYEEFILGSGKAALLPVAEQFGRKNRITSELKIGDYSPWGHPKSIKRDMANATLYKWGYDGDCIIDVQRQYTPLHTRYSHIPLVGCDQISYPSGRKEYYEYEAGRLSLLRNTSGRKVSSWDYIMAESAGGVNSITASVYLSENGIDCMKEIGALDAFGGNWFSISTGYGGNGENVISGYIERDGFGREIRHHNSYTTPYDDPMRCQYIPRRGSGLYADSLAFSSTDYSSMLNRTVWRRSAGDDMAERYNAVSFRFNRSDDPRLKCQTITMRSPGSNVPVMRSTAPDGLYTVEQTIDADEHERLIFTDFQGRKVLDRRIVDDTNLDTYYVYDDLGRLRYVLPPRLSNVQLTKSSIDRFGYIYTYNDSMLMTSKKLPGCDPVTFVYDGARNLVLSQDGEQRKRGEQTFILYGHSGQPTVTGICSTMRSSIAHTWALGDYQGMSCDNRGNTDSCGVRWTYGIPEPRLLKVNYYNHYDFLAMPPCRRLAESLPGDLSLTSRPGLPTGSLTAILSPDGPTGEYEVALTTYDDEERPTATVSLRPDGMLETTLTEYTFDGLPSKLSHSVKYQNTLHTEEYTTVYDQARRPMRTTIAIDGGAPRPLTTCSYDAIGRLATWQPGAEAKVSYSYNIRNQLASSRSNHFTEVLHYTSGGVAPSYNGNVSAYSWTVPGMLSQMYNYLYDGADRLISASLRNDGSGRDYSTTYSYDQNSNIKTLTRKGLLDDGTYGLVDDLMMTYTGNQLTRVTDGVDEILLENSLDFTDGADQQDEITYDSRGYMITDLNRGITEIRYNEAGLPAEVYIDEVKRLSFTYTADSRLLDRTEYVTPKQFEGTILPGIGVRPPGGYLPWPGSGGGDTTTDTPKTISVTYRYGGSQLWKGTKLDRIETEAGFFIGDTLHAAYRDFQGNVRAVVAGGEVRQLTHYYPYGLPWAETLVPTHSLRKYSGKELYTHSGYDTYNFEARQYHPAVPRFTSPDPLAEKFYEMGIYTFCAANPIRNVDPSGMDHYQMDEKANFTLIKQTDDNFDVISSVSNETIMIAKDFMNNLKTEVKIPTAGEVNYVIGEYSFSNQDLTQLYEFIVTNVDVEVSHIQTKSSNGFQTDYIGTTQFEGSDASMTYMADKINKGEIIQCTHNHPSCSNIASKGDIKVAAEISKDHPNAIFYILNPCDFSRIEYDQYTLPGLLPDVDVYGSVNP